MKSKKNWEFYLLKSMENEFLLKYKEKWIWFFFEDIQLNIFDIEFSRDFTDNEQKDFLENLKCLFDFEIIN